MMLERKENWRNLLLQHINKRMEYPFSYGRHDCCIAATGCIKVMTGVGLAREFAKYGRKDEAEEILKNNDGLEKMAESVAAKYELEEIDIAYAQAGDAVLHKIGDQFALGIMYLDPTHFISPKRPKGWGFVEKDQALRVWRI